MRTSKKNAIIIAGIMIVAGLVISVGAMAVRGFDFTTINTVSFVTNTYTIDEEFSNISINGDECDVRLLPSEDESCKVVCYENDKVYHSVEVKDDTLTIERHDNRKWYEYIGVYWRNMEIKVYLPEKEYTSLYAKNQSGDIVIPENFSFDSADVQSTSGGINFTASVKGELSTKTTSGELYVGKTTPSKLNAQSKSGELAIEDVTVQETITFNATSGDVELSGIKCKSITGGTTSGGVDFSDVITSENISIECSSGDVELYKCDADSLWLQTKSGNVSGTFLTEKIFLTDTSSGDIDVPHSASGGKCEITTTSGDIECDIG